MAFGLFLGLVLLAIVVLVLLGHDGVITMDNVFGSGDGNDGNNGTTTTPGGTSPEVTGPGETPTVTTRTGEATSGTSGDDDSEDECSCGEKHSSSEYYYESKSNSDDECSCPEDEHSSYTSFEQHFHRRHRDYEEPDELVTPRNVQAPLNAPEDDDCCR